MLHKAAQVAQDCIPIARNIMANVVKFVDEQDQAMVRQMLPDGSEVVLEGLGRVGLEGVAYWLVDLSLFIQPNLLTNASSEAFQYLSLICLDSQHLQVDKDGSKGASSQVGGQAIDQAGFAHA